MIGGIQGAFSDLILVILVHTATLGSYCFLARPERNGILIKTNTLYNSEAHSDPCLALGSLVRGWIYGQSLPLGGPHSLSLDGSFQK